MTRLAKCLLLLLTLLSGFNAVAPEESVAQDFERPNLIFILVDDQGYYDLGCYGATEVATPNVDAMAKEGLRFTDYYAAAPICSPSRAGILTGCYPRRVGLESWVQRADSRQGIHPDELTLAELLKSEGYATACIGKWHLGFHEPFLPRQQGFDHYFGLLHNLDPVEVVYFEDQGGVPLLRNGEVVERPADPATLTRRYTDEAIRFIEAHREQPFFLYLPHTMLHHPLGVSDEFKGSSQWGEYGDAIQEIDHHIGRLFQTLTDLELNDKTMVIYVSDNGRGPGRRPDQKIRGRKLSTYEGGLRVPAIAWGPGIGVQGNAETAVPVRAMDWYPTLATMAGIEVPAGLVIDGRDMASLLEGKSDQVEPPYASTSINAKVPWRRRWEPPGEWEPLVRRQEYIDAFFYHGSQGALAAVRWRRWKLVLNPTPSLYDLEKDPGEETPVRNPELIRKLRGMAIMFQEEMRRDARPAGRVPASPTPESRTEVPSEVTQGLNIQRDVVYATYGDRKLTMDLFRPKNAWGALPAIVSIHGGGWFKGDRSSQENLSKALAAEGYVIANISYRLSGEAPFPAAIQDCKAAVRFLRAHAKQYGVDRENIGAIGLSAGGHLTALLATSGDVPELEGQGGYADWSSTIQAAIPLGAQTHLLSPRVGEVSVDEERGQNWRQFLGGTQAERNEAYALASPLYHLDKEDPPCWLISGQKDHPSTRGSEFRGRLQELDIAEGGTVIADAPHAFLGKQIWFDEMFRDASRFFDKHLKRKPRD